MTPVSVDPAPDELVTPAGSARPGGEGGGREPAPWWRRWWWAIAILVGIGVAVGVLIAIAVADDGAEVAVEDETVPPTEIETTTTSPSTTTEAATTTTETATTTSEAATTTTGPPATTTTTTVTTTTAADSPALPTFESGTQLVGIDVEPGLYVADDVSECSWARLSGLGGSVDEIIATADVEGRALVEIAETDEAFESSGCATWTLAVLPVTGAPLPAIGDGYWRVGVDIDAGRWSIGEDVSGCYWERLSGFTGEPSDIVTFGRVDGRVIIDIPGRDVGFASIGCGTWEKIG